MEGALVACELDGCIERRAALMPCLPARSRVVGLCGCCCCGRCCCCCISKSLSRRALASFEDVSDGVLSCCIVHRPVSAVHLLASTSLSRGPCGRRLSSEGVFPLVCPLFAPQKKKKLQQQSLSITTDDVQASCSQCRCHPGLVCPCW